MFAVPAACSQWSHLHLSRESSFWSLNGRGPGLAGLDSRGLRLSLLCELHSKCSSVWGASRGIWPPVITGCFLGLPRGKASRTKLLCKGGASSFFPGLLSRGVSLLQGSCTASAALSLYPSPPTLLSPKQKCLQIQPQMYPVPLGWEYLVWRRQSEQVLEMAVGGATS